jgi:hypothetical protein
MLIEGQQKIIFKEVKQKGRAKLSDPAFSKLIAVR